MDYRYSVLLNTARTSLQGTNDRMLLRPFAMLFLYSISIRYGLYPQTARAIPTIRPRTKPFITASQGLPCRFGVLRTTHDVRRIFNPLSAPRIPHLPLSSHPPEASRDHPKRTI